MFSRLIYNDWHDFGVSCCRLRYVLLKLNFTMSWLDATEDVTRSFRPGIRILKKLSFQNDFIGPLLEYAEAIV